MTLNVLLLLLLTVDTVLLDIVSGYRLYAYCWDIMYCCWKSSVPTVIVRYECMVIVEFVVGLVGVVVDGLLLLHCWIVYGVIDAFDLTVVDVVPQWWKAENSLPYCWFHGCWFEGVGYWFSVVLFIIVYTCAY